MQHFWLGGQCELGPAMCGFQRSLSDGGDWSRHLVRASTCIMWVSARLAL